MTNVIPFPKKKKENEPHLCGVFVCMKCKHEWDGTKPVDSQPFIQCPKCELVYGHSKTYVLKGALQWECGCGNGLFRICQEYGVYCPYCGKEQRWF